MNLRYLSVVFLLLPPALGFLASPAQAISPPYIAVQEEEKSPRIPDTSPGEFLRDLRDLEDLDPTTVPLAAFDELTLTRDAGRISFTDGWVTPVEVRGVLVGAVLYGRGTFEMTPPDPMEKWQMEHFFDGPTARIELKSAFLLFADSTMAEGG